MTLTLQRGSILPGKRNGEQSNSRLHFFNTDVGPLLNNHKYSRSSWVQLNRLRIGIVRFGSLMFKWGLITTTACDCGSDLA